MITGLTLKTNRSNIFNNMYDRLNPKPDEYIIYEDNEPLSDHSMLSKLMRIGKNYNLAKKLIPNNTDYVFILEDDVEVPINIIDILYNDLINYDADCITTVTKCRRTGAPMCWDSKFETIENTGIKKIYATSLNCLIIKKELFDKMIFVGFDTAKNKPIDANFFIMLNYFTDKIYCNYNVPTIHAYNQLYKGRYKCSKKIIKNLLRKEPLLN